MQICDTNQLVPWFTRHGSPIIIKYLNFQFQRNLKRFMTFNLNFIKATKIK